jgi:hypothetical protein
MCVLQMRSSMSNALHIHSHTWRGAGCIEVVEWRARAPDGSVRLQESALADSLRRQAASSPASVSVLHVVIGSKTGLVYPSLRLVRALQAELGEQLLVAVDACQLRCKLSAVREYVQDLDAFVLVTGSKFFCGPAFCGAVVVPSSHALALEAHLAATLPSAGGGEGEGGGGGGACVVPVGLQSYLTPQDVCARMPHLRSLLDATNNEASENTPPSLPFYLSLSLSLTHTHTHTHSSL